MDHLQSVQVSQRLCHTLDQIQRLVTAPLCPEKVAQILAVEHLLQPAHRRGSGRVAHRSQTAADGHDASAGR